MGAKLTRTPLVPKMMSGLAGENQDQPVPEGTMVARAFSRRGLLGLGAGLAFTALADWSRPGPATAEADLIVYGATVAGISAAIQARRMGRTALILEPSTHIGGMTTGGLGYTDIGAPDSVG